METYWYYHHDGQTFGPLPFQALCHAAAAGQLAPADLVAQAGMPSWTAASAVSGLFVTLPSDPSIPIALPPPPPLPPPSIQYAAPHAPSIGDDPGIRLLLPVGRSGWAIAAGYAGLFSVLCFPGPIAIILSIVAIRDMRTHPHRHGWGRAIFGLIMGILGTIGLVMMAVANWSPSGYFR